MDLNSINANVNRLLSNIWAIIAFLREFAVDGAKDVSITYLNADGSESTKTFPNIAKIVQACNLKNDNGVLKDLDGVLLFENHISGNNFTYENNIATFTKNIKILKNGAHSTFLLEYKSNINGNGSGSYEGKILGYLAFMTFWDGSSVKLKMDFIQIFNSAGGTSPNDEIVASFKFAESDSNVITYTPDGNYDVAFTFDKSSVNYSKIALRDISENLTVA